MARKLKADRVMFTATLLLVFASIIMVYSASALVALERFNSRTVRDPAGHVGRSRYRRALGGDARGLPRLSQRHLRLGAHRVLG